MRTFAPHLYDNVAGGNICTKLAIAYGINFIEINSILTSIKNDWYPFKDLRWQQI